jgi:hypothetical protein
MSPIVFADVDPNSAAYKVGVVFGAVFAGVICGLIPLAVGRSRERMGFGWTGFLLCIVAGFFVGLLGALPTAAVVSVVILVAGRPAKKPQGQSAGRPPKMPTPQEYDL